VKYAIRNTTIKKTIIAIELVVLVAVNQNPAFLNVGYTVRNAIGR